MDNDPTPQTADKKNPKTKLIILIAALAVLAIGGFLVFGSGTTSPPEPGGDTAGSQPADDGPEAANDSVSSTETNPDGGEPVQIGPPGAPSQPAPADNDGQTGVNQPAGETETETETETSVAPAAGQYVDYQGQAQLDQLAGQERWLSFHADWCPQCRALDADINANLDQIPAGVTIVKVDFDDNQPLRQQYGVTQQTTIVRIGADDQVAASYVAYSQPTLASVIAGLGS